MKKALIFALICMMATPAFALTLAEKKEMQHWQDQMKDEGNGAAFKEKCGYDLPVTMAEDLVTPFMEQNSNAASYCDEVVSQMASMCEDKLSKEAIAGKIKSLSCHYKKDAPKGEYAIAPEGDLSFSFDPDTSNVGDNTKEYLEKNL